MFETNEILEKAISKKDLTKKEKFTILHYKGVDREVLKYLIIKLSGLRIKILGDCEGSLFDLMVSGELEGWCWETTESAIVFMNDNDYIERGILKLDEKTPKYYHSWICFIFNGNEYVLDPCLSLLCKKNDYSKIFEVDVKGRVSARRVKEELIRQVTTPKKEENSELDEHIDSLIKKIMGPSYDSYQEDKKGEVTVYSTENVNAPLYRNSAGYKMELEKGKVKQLKVHYYCGDF